MTAKPPVSDGDEGPDARNGQFPALSYSTADFPEDEKGVSWSRMIEAVFDIGSGQFAPPECRLATLRSYHFGDFLLCYTYVDSGRYIRSDARIRLDDLDHYVIHLMLRGDLAFGLRRWGASLRPLDIGILDLSVPSIFSMFQGEGISLILPRTRFLPPRSNPLGCHGRRFLRENPMAALLARQMIGLAVEAPRLTIRDGAQAAAAIARTVALTLDLRGDANPVYRDRGGPTIGHQVRACVERNLQDETLTPGDIAHELAISRSQLYRAFEGHGGVQKYIQRRRLRRAFRALRDPDNADRRIGEIAYEVGFSDVGYFSRAFRKTYGMPPRAVRLAVDRDGLTAMEWTAFAPSTPATETLSDWLHELMAG